MKRTSGWCVGAFIAMFATPAMAQWYMQSDPCGPPPTLPGYVIMLTPQATAQRAEACQRQRDEANRQQQAAIAAEQAREAEVQAQEQERQAALAAAQVAAETSPDNFCREPDTARQLMNQYNGLDWSLPRKVVDIEHLVTIRKDVSSGILVCHGVWVHTDGEKIEGTMTMRPNVAGDIIVAWKPGHWEPAVSTWVRPQPAPVTPAMAAALSPTSSTFEQGLGDRKTWETWFAATAGDYRAGAFYWSGQRSLPHPGSCTSLGGDGAAGCAAAQERLAISDSRRKSDPEYRTGWNSYQGQ